MRTMQDQWDVFSAMIMPDEATDTQRREMKRSFYAGAQSLMMALHEVGDEDITEDAGAHIIEGYNQELNFFFERIGIDC